MGGDELEPWDVQHEIVRALMAGVRRAAQRMKSRLPDDVDVNDVVSAGYLALAQALAYWQDDCEEPFVAHATKRASAAMVAAVRSSSSPPSFGRRFVSEMASVRQSLIDALDPGLDERKPLEALDTIVSPPPPRDVVDEDVDDRVA